MSDHVFMMGKFEAQIPSDRMYAKNHMWASQSEDVWTFGLSAYAVRLLQDVYFLDWYFDPNSKAAKGQAIGQIESSKAESELYAPIEGVMTEINEELLSDPSAINVDKYDKGWLFKTKGSGEGLLTVEEYLQHLDTSWEVAQKTIKGQIQ
jgi:glycine cleavage system H protein